jgi:hypothetical protein
MTSIHVSFRLFVYGWDRFATLRSIQTDLVANKSVDEAFADRDGWLKKSIMTVAKVHVCSCSPCGASADRNVRARWASSVLTAPS